MLALSVQLRLLAPFLPYVTEEVWSWWQEGSVHRAPWPVADDLRAAAGGADGDAALALAVAGEVLSLLRKAKSDAKVSMRTEIATATVTDTPERLAALERVRADVIDAGRVQSLETVEGSALSIETTLAEG